MRAHIRRSGRSKLEAATRSVQWTSADDSSNVNMYSHLAQEGSAVEMGREVAVRGRQKRSLLTEQRLIAAVSHQLSEAGSAGRTVLSFAKRAGVAVGTASCRYAG